MARHHLVDPSLDGLAVANIDLRNGVGRDGVASLDGVSRVGEKLRCGKPHARGRAGDDHNGCLL